MNKTNYGENIINYEICLHTHSGFSMILSYSRVETPNGKIRTFYLKDEEITMTDKEICPPGDCLGFTANDNDVIIGEPNKKELKLFLKAVLKDLK